MNAVESITLRIVRLLLTQIFLKTPQLLGALPQIPLYSVYTFGEKSYCIKLYFEFDCLDFFSPIFALPTEK